MARSSTAAERIFPTLVDFIEELHALVRELNDRTRCVGLHLTDGENSAGAENVLAWRTGYARAIDFARGFPRFGPAEFSAERLLERSQVDAFIVVGEESLARLSPAAREAQAAIPTICIDWRDSELLCRGCRPACSASWNLRRRDIFSLGRRSARAASANTSKPPDRRRSSPIACRRIGRLKPVSTWAGESAKQDSEIMPSLFKISGGAVYDPANGVDGAVRDVWIEGGSIVLPPSDSAMRPAREIDARGLVVMPGGVDMHCHIAGPKVNAARRMLPEERPQIAPRSTRPANPRRHAR